jgi:dTDP-glucose 4,6-dehydratase
MHIDDGRVVPNFITQAIRGEPLTVYGDGSQSRSFCYVDDLVEGIYSLLMVEENYPINLGNPYELTVLEFANLINDLTDNKAGKEFQHEKRTEGDPERRQPDISRAKEILGWEPNVSLEDGLKRTIEFFRKELNGA